MKKNNLFYQLYDTLYASKDYAGEVASIMSIAKTTHPGMIKKILEIGCGTGNHTVELAKTKKKITAIDTDVNMAATAKTKTKNLKNVRIHFGSVEKLDENGFELVIAAFNVVTYIQDMKSLLLFFQGVSSSLRNKGIFIFDCWNGIAAIKDPPQTKIIKCNAGGKKIICEIKSHTDLFNQKTKLEYFLKTSDKRKNTVTKDSFSFNQTLWTPAQLIYALEENNFQVLECCKNFLPGKRADESDWKIMFVCKK